MSEVKRRNWEIEGTDGTDPTTDFIGTDDATDLRIATNSNTQFRFIQATGAIQREDDGDARGDNAIDLPGSRNLASQVASGENAVSLGGLNHTVSGDNSAVIAGSGGSVSGNTSAILGGTTNQIISTDNNNTITGGSGNTVQGVSRLGAIVGGQMNDVDDSVRSVIMGGTTNTIDAANDSAILVGNNNSITANNGFIVGSNTSSVSGVGSAVIGGQNITVSDVTAVAVGGGTNTIDATSTGANSIMSGTNNQITGTAGLSSIEGGTQNTITDATAGSIINSQLCNINTGIFNQITNAFNSTIDATQNCSILGGSTNAMNANALLSVMCSGVSCTMDNTIGFMGNGSGNTINSGATASSIVNGGQNTISTGVFGATIVNSFGSSANAAFQCITGGSLSAIRQGEILHNAGNFGSPTDSIAGTGALRVQTSDATPTEMTIVNGVGAPQGLDIALDHTAAFRFAIVARSTGGADRASWFFDCQISDQAGVLVLDSPGVAIAPTHNTAGAVGWTITPVVGAAPNRLVLNVAGAAATNIRWKAHYRFSEVEFT